VPAQRVKTSVTTGAIARSALRMARVAGERLSV